MGLKINFQFTISSIILALFAIAFSAIVNADSSSSSSSCPTWDANHYCGTINSGTNGQSSLNFGGCQQGWATYCGELQNCLKQQISAANEICSDNGYPVKGSDFSSCRQGLSTSCVKSGNADPSDIADGTTPTSPDCQIQVGTNYCCQKETDQKSMTSADGDATKAQQQVQQLQSDDQKSITDAQNQATTLQNNLTKQLLDFQDASSKNHMDTQKVVSDLISQLQQAMSDQAQLANQQQLAEQQYSLDMRQANDACRAALYKYQQPGNAYGLGSLSAGLTSASKGGLVNNQCSGNLSTPWGQAYEEGAMAAAQKYYGAIAALNKQNSDYNVKIASIRQQVSNLTQNEGTTDASINARKNATMQTTNQQIQQALMAAQQKRQLDQQNAQALQQNFQKAQTLQKQATTDYQKALASCNDFKDNDVAVGSCGSSSDRSPSSSSSSSSGSVGSGDYGTILKGEAALDYSKPAGCGSGDVNTGNWSTGATYSGGSTQ